MSFLIGQIKKSVKVLSWMFDNQNIRKDTTMRQPMLPTLGNNIYIELSIRSFGMKLYREYRINRYLLTRSQMNNLSLEVVTYLQMRVNSIENYMNDITDSYSLPK